MQKSLIFKDNKDKSFVYRWINKVNNKEYLGSTANAKRRLLKYYDLSSLNLVSMPIYKAILKHGHSNFIFEIIEYCEPDKVLEREQYYLDNFDFDYNVLEKADSIFGYKHTEETKELLSQLQEFFGGVGTFRMDTRDNIFKYSVSERKDLINVIIPHFTEYPLISKKSRDFLLWSKVIEIILNKEHLTEEGFLKILSYYASINKGVSKKVKKYYPDIISVGKPGISLPENLNPQ